LLILLILSSLSFLFCERLQTPLQTGSAPTKIMNADKKVPMSRAASVCIAAACLVAAVQCTAQGYPSKPVRLVIPYTPGGPTDLVGRAVAQRLQAALGQQIVVDNRAGGGGVIGTEIVARAAPDGHTLLLGTPGQLVLLPLLSDNLPYAVGDLASVTKVVDSPQVLIANAKLPASNVSELVTYAKQHRGQMTYGSVQTGGTGHLGMELLKQMTGIDMLHVAYKGTAPALTDLIAGRIQVMFSSLPSVQPHVQAERLKLLATGALQRTAAIKEVPTIAETLPGYELMTWYAIFAPRRTPAPVIRKLHGELVKILTSPDIAQVFTAQGVDAAHSTPQELEAYMHKESERWSKVIKTAGIRLE
jgi:tripartite-type tricarboxylate transporter receptor subunit TctC